MIKQAWQWLTGEASAQRQGITKDWPPPGTLPLSPCWPHRTMGTNDDPTYAPPPAPPPPPPAPASGPMPAAVMARNIGRLRLAPGDVIVLQYSGHIGAETRAKLAAMVESAAPGHKALVLDGGVTISTMGSEAPPQHQPDPAASQITDARAAAALWQAAVLLQHTEEGRSWLGRWGPVIDAAAPASGAYWAKPRATAD